MLNVGLDLAGKVHVVCHCAWMLLKIQFLDSVECRLRKSRWVTFSTDLWITSKCFMYCADVIYWPSGSSSSRLFSISVLASLMCRIFRKIPQNRLGTWRLSVWRSFFKTLNYPLWTSSASHAVVLKAVKAYSIHCVCQIGYMRDIVSIRQW